MPTEETLRRFLEVRAEEERRRPPPTPIDRPHARPIRARRPVLRLVTPVRPANAANHARKFAGAAKPLDSLPTQAHGTQRRSKNLVQIDTGRSRSRSSGIARRVFVAACDWRWRWHGRRLWVAQVDYYSIVGVLAGLAVVAFTLSELVRQGGVK